MDKYEIKLNENEYVDIEFEKYDNDSNSITILSSDELLNIGILRNAYIKTSEGEKKYTRMIKLKEERKVVLKAIEIWESTHSIPA